MDSYANYRGVTVSLEMVTKRQYTREITFYDSLWRFCLSGWDGVKSRAKYCRLCRQSRISAAENRTSEFLVVYAVALRCALVIRIAAGIWYLCSPMIAVVDNVVPSC